MPTAMAGPAADAKEENIVMFPFMAQGHIIPFLALAFQLQQRTNYQITVVNTPLNIKKIRTSLPPDTPIRLVELPFSCTDHGLPPDSENTDSVPYPLICTLLEASLSLKPSFNQLIVDMTQEHGHPPLCIIVDMFLGWTVEIANELNIFHCIFQTGSAYGTAIWSSLWLNLPHLQTSSLEFSLPDFPEASTIHLSQLANNIKTATGTDSWSVIVQKLFQLWWKTDCFLFNTVEELDQTGLNYFRRKTGNKPVWAFPPSLSSTSTEKPIRSQRKSGIELQDCIEWLDKQSPASVLFVSFGSQNTISSSHLMELAIGLETSGMNFIWVVRPPIGFDINAEFRSEWLPEGFEDRVKQAKRGLIVRNWAPQSEILSHRSTCAFLSHCGWNSVLESMSNGVPMIGWPLGSEQFFNSKMLEEEVGAGIEVARGTACEIKYEEIQRVIELVMGGTEKGKDMRTKATQMKDMIRDAIREDVGHKGSSLKALDDFISATLCARNTKLKNYVDFAAESLFFFRQLSRCQWGLNVGPVNPTATVSTS